MNRSHRGGQGFKSPQLHPLTRRFLDQPCECGVAWVTCRVTPVLAAFGIFESDNLKDVYGNRDLTTALRPTATGKADSKCTAFACETRDGLSHRVS